ncbi:hypothetical protein QCA50_014824 [Cerrena zonata]|uniref:F-box domain-containing protein n=1 Tax=Cerrena zonata TaxID=2478898 RepID=A0AAW0FQ57_9APHY
MHSVTQQLPKDALTRVYYFTEPTFDDFGITPANFEYYRHFVWAQNISLVCRNWRAAFVQSPELWTTIIWRPRRKAYIRAALKRSGKLPIKVYALSGMEDEGSHEYDLSDDFNDEGYGPTGLKISYLNMAYSWNKPDPPIQASTLGKYYDPLDFYEDVAKHLDRLKSFHLTIPGFRMKSLARYFSKPAPMLETLTLGTSIRSLDLIPKVVSRLFDGQATSLKHLTLKNYKNWPILFTKNLTHLSLVRLHLEDAAIYHTFLDALYVANKLEVLIVDLSGEHREFKTSPQGRAPIQLDSLQTLAINTATPTGTSNLLAHIALPPTACIALCLSSNAKLDSFFPNDRIHLRNLPDPFELVLFWEFGDYASPMIKSGRNGLPVFASTAVPIDDLSRYLRDLGSVFDLRQIRRLSSYHKSHGELRDHKPGDWQRVLKALPNLEAVHLYNYTPFTLLNMLSGPNEAPGLEKVRGEFGVLRETIKEAGDEAKSLEKTYEEAKEHVRMNRQSYTSLTSISPYIHHQHKLGQTTPLDVTLNGKPAEARITYGCQWKYGSSGNHEMFVETSVVLKTALNCRDEEMTMTAREEISILKPWWQKWLLYFGSPFVVPMMLNAQYEPGW